MAELLGWHVDLCLRHEARYFSDCQPTNLVRDGTPTRAPILRLLSRPCDRPLSGHPHL